MNRWRWLLLLPFVVVIAFLAIRLRLNAVYRLPIDFDEMTYLPMAFRYRDMMTNGRWKEILYFRENLEHPPLNKLVFAGRLMASRAQEPDWKKLDVPMSIPPSDQTAFFGPRKLSAYAGVLQVVIIALIHPIGGLLLALDSYHIKYSAQVYLEGLPGLLAVLAVSIFELAIRRKKNSSPAEPVHWMPLIFSAVFLGLAGAGKYIYGMVGPVMLGFLIGRRVRFRQLLLFPLVALAVFILADPFLWPNPPARLWESVMYHWDYSHSQHVVSSGMPWYSPFYHLTHASPTEWHPGVFPTGIVDIIILPLGIIGIPWAIRRRPIWVAWAGFGLLFLIFWPTKWPQYTLLVLPPLCVCAGIGVEQIFRSWFKGWSRS